MKVLILHALLNPRPPGQEAFSGGIPGLIHQDMDATTAKVREWSLRASDRKEIATVTMSVVHGKDTVAEQATVLVGHDLSRGRQ